MTRLSQSDMRRLLGLLRVCDAFPDLATLRTGTLPALDRLIPCDSAAYMLTDRRTGKIDWTGHQGFVSPALQAAFKRLEHQHPAVAWYRSNPGGPALQTSDFLTPREWRRLDLYHEFMRPLEAEHQMSIAFRIPGQMSIGLPMNRKSSAFSERERLLLDLTRPHLLQLHRRARARARAQEQIAALEGDVERAGRAVVLLGSGDSAPYVSGQARTLLRTYFPEEGSLPGHLPDTVAGWLRAARRRLDDIGHVPEPDRTLGAVAARGRLSVTYLPATEGDQEALLIEERRDGLTAREADVLRGLRRGLTDAQIGYELAISPRTVGVHLGRIYRKLGVANRAQAIASARESVRARATAAPTGTAAVVEARGTAA